MRRLSQLSIAKIEIKDPEPHKEPIPDSPDFDTPAEEEIFTSDDHETEWQDIVTSIQKNEFFRLKDIEYIHKTQIKSITQELIEKNNLLQEIYPKFELLKSSYLELKKLSESEKNEITKKLEKTLQENQEKDILIESMQKSKMQMRELFIEKEVETDKLKKNIENLMIQLSEYQLCDTKRYSEEDITLPREIVDASNTLDKANNIKFFSRLLLVSEGILFKNRKIEVGISVKFERNLAKAYIYIGNCGKSSFRSLETTLETNGITGQINKTVEENPVPPQSQANRVIFFECTKFFETPPLLYVKYNNSIKVLKLPITAALFVKANSSPNIVEDWESIKSSEVIIKQQVTTLIDEDLVIERLKFSPFFSVFESQQLKLLVCDGFYMKISLESNEIAIECRSSNSSLMAALSLLIEIQLSQLA